MQHDLSQLPMESSKRHLKCGCSADIDSNVKHIQSTCTQCNFFSIRFEYSMIVGVYAHKSPELEMMYCKRSGNHQFSDKPSEKNIADCWLHITPRTCSHCLPMAIRRYLTNPNPIILPVKSHQSYHNETEFRRIKAPTIMSSD